MAINNGTLVLVNLSYPALTPTVSGTYRGDSDGRAIVQLADQSIKLVEHEALTLPPVQPVKVRQSAKGVGNQAPKRAYDTSFRDLTANVKGFNVACARNNSNDKADWKFRVFGDANEIEMVTNHLLGNYRVKEVSPRELLVSVRDAEHPAVTEETVSIPDSEEQS